MAKGKGSRSCSYETIDDWLKARPRQDRRRLQGSLTRLRKLYGNRPEPEDFTWWHHVGSQVAELIPKSDRHYGENVIELLAQHLEPDREDFEAPCYFLRKTRNFADKFTRDEALELTEADLREGHIKAVLSVEDKTQRQRLLDECLEKSWSVQYLRQKIHDIAGRRRSGAGRKPTRPKRQSAGVALRNILVMSRQWLRNHEVWFGKPGCFSGRIKRRDRETILEDAESAIEELEEMQEAITDGLEQLTSFVRELKEQSPT
jgi:hypothetical protein